MSGQRTAETWLSAEQLRQLRVAGRLRIYGTDDKGEEILIILHA